MPRTDEVREACGADRGDKEGNEMKKLVMISQPMAGRSTWEIDDTRNRAIAELEQRGYYVVNTFFTGAWHGKEKLEGQGVVQISLPCKVIGKDELLPRCLLLPRVAGCTGLPH